MTGYHNQLVKLSEMKKVMQSTKVRFESFLALSFWPSIGVDLSSNFRSSPWGRSFYRKNMRNQKK